MEQIGRVDESSWFFRNVVERRVALGYVAAAALLLLACPTRATVFLGLIPALAGEALRTWSSGVILKRAALTTEGPYEIVRNPLYVGNFLIGAGFAVMSGSFTLLVLFVIGFTAICRAVVAGEEKFLLERYGESYEVYCRKVPRFLPRGVPWPLPRAPYDAGRMFHGHREWRVWGALYGATLFLLLKAL